MNSFEKSGVVLRDGKTWRKMQHRAGHWQRLCWHEVSDGNRDDPTYGYCGLPHGHAGEHGAWVV